MSQVTALCGMFSRLVAKMQWISHERLSIGLVIDDDDRYIRPVEAALHKRHRLERFRPKFVRLPIIGAQLNERLLDHQLQGFLQQHDVVFFEWAGALLVRATRLTGHGRIVTRLHSVELATSAEQIDWSAVDHLILLNQAILSRLHGLSRKPLPPVTIVANGVALARYHPQVRHFDYRLGMVCNLLPIKRVYEMVLSVSQLRQAGHPFVLHVAGAPGDGETRRYVWAIESLIEKLQLSDAVFLHGPISEVAMWLQDIDIFISNSYWEGQQVALIEAMASGCYCLSHCWSGVEDILPTENIYVTDVELCTKLLAYAALSECEKRNLQLEMHRIAVEKFDEERMIEGIVSVIEQVARNK